MPAGIEIELGKVPPPSVDMSICPSVFQTYIAEGLTVVSTPSNATDTVVAVWVTFAPVAE